MDPIDQAILPYAVVPESPNVFLCGCFERFVSINLQAIRALNLAWALCERQRLGSRVCVIGGGFAGLTLAAGLARRGVRVTLQEREGELLATQRHNHVRAIHPHIHEWPRRGALDTRAGLPLLDWHAGVSADVATEILAGFDKVRAHVDVVVNAASVALDDGAFDTYLLALGVGIEKSFGALPLRSYWSDDGISAPHTDRRHHYLVTGIGEGGVIDVLYLRLRDFTHLGIATALERVAGIDEVKAQLLAIEASIEGATDAEANARLQQCYATLQVPAEIDALLRGRLRDDTQVTLNGPEPFALAPRADILNRFLISRLLALGAITYVPGKIASLVSADTGFRATLDTGTTLAVDDVKVRHGTVPSLKAAYPALWEKYYPARIALPHLTPEPYWPDGYFS